MKVLTRADMIKLWYRATEENTPTGYLFNDVLFAACIQAAAIEWAAYVEKQVGVFVTHKRDAYDE